ncbi:cytochrome d ubiquinol oxidase subunit II [Ideonella livida]
MDLSTWLPLGLMAVMGLALLAYVVLDGYDLGVGLLMPFAAETDQDVMVASIGPFWDANETWLVLGVGLLLVAFPHAHGVVLSALYLPVTVMLVGLILRGVAFEFRAKAQAAHRRLWNALFSVGSLVAALAQGWMLGAYVTGFAPGIWAQCFSLGVALTLPAAYALLGAGWLLMKTEGALQRQALAWGRAAFWPMVLALLGISLATPVVSPTVMDKWFSMPGLLLLLPVPGACAVALAAIHHVLHRPRTVVAGYGGLVFLGTVLLFVLAFLGLAYSLYPYVVIDRLTVWQAASATESLRVIAIGLGLTLPVIVGYTVFLYRVFGGKAQALSYGG